MLTPRPTQGDTDWFMRDRFGMFIHWGLYALPARHEWVQSREEIAPEDYRVYFERFNPVCYDPRHWARLAREAGMKYAVLTTKHHEGFRASWDGVTGIVDDTVLEDNIKAWSGDHCIDPALVPGVLFSSLRLRTDQPSIMDLAPTVLELFGLTPPAHMDGRGLVDAAALSREAKGKKA